MDSDEIGEEKDKLPKASPDSTKPDIDKVSDAGKSLTHSLSGDLPENKKRRVIISRFFNHNIIGSRVVSNITTILALATTIVVLYYTKEAVDVNNNQASGNYILNFDRDYFSKEFDQLLPALDMDAVMFIENPHDSTEMYTLKRRYPDFFPDDFPYNYWKDFPDDFPIFWVTHKYRKIFDSTNPTKMFYSTYDIDRIVLNNLDMLGQYYVSNDIRDIDYIYHSMGWYLELAWESRPIKEYVIWLRENYTDETAHYHNIERIYEDIRAEHGKPGDVEDSMISSDRIKKIAGQDISNGIAELIRLGITIHILNNFNQE